MGPIAGHPVRPPAEPKPRMRGWMVAALVAWLVVLAAAAGWALWRGAPTAREQTTMVDAAPVMTRVQAELAAAASADGLAVVALSQVERSACDVSVARRGVRFQAPVLAFVPPGTEQALLQRIADRLPPSYEAHLRAGTVPRLVADAGLWVAVAGSVVAPGQVRLVADTGACRVLADYVAPDVADGDRVPVQAALARLGMAATTWTVTQAACAGTGTVQTVEAVAPIQGEPGPLDEVLAGLSGPGKVVATDALVAYQRDEAGVAIRLVNDRVVVTSTTVGCR
jgi:hypothetical protein